ncbi:tautomerase family protein [Williamsia sp.]|uniref:tautomerase family protein n=1 Tax=Williamsia sp. TaxID=1872085 RepID=UPI002F94D66A
MPVFNAYIPAARFSPQQKQALGSGLPGALHEALRIPREDQFVIIPEQPADSLFVDPSYMGMSRSENAVIITVLFTAERALSDKRAIVRAMCDKTVSALGISADDVFIALIPVPKENFSFGRGDLQLAQG